MNQRVNLEWIEVVVGEKRVAISITSISHVNEEEGGYCTIVLKSGVEISPSNPYLGVREVLS